MRGQQLKVTWGGLVFLFKASAPLQLCSRVSSSCGETAGDITAKSVRMQCPCAGAHSGGTGPVNTVESIGSLG